MGDTLKESMWGYMILTLGILAVGIIWFFANVTRTDQHNYNLLKETTEAAMVDAIDLAAYRKDGTVRIEEEKFVENFIRRFAENADLSNEYLIEIYDVREIPPKVSMKVSSTKETNATGEIVEFDIVNNIDAILETTYLAPEWEGPVQNTPSKIVCRAYGSGDGFYLGQMYQCEVSKSEYHNFYLLNETKNEIILIMNQNLNTKFSKQNPKESDKNSTLENLTKNWSNINEVRLPAFNDIRSLASSKQDYKYQLMKNYNAGVTYASNAYYYDLSGYRWLYENLSDSNRYNSAPLAYWFSDKDLCMYKDGKLWHGMDIYSNIPDCGIRPVIIVPKDECRN